MKSKGNVPALMDQDLVSALSHPLRLHILDALSETVASPSDLAREVGLDVNYVAYHVKELCKVGYLELVRTEPRRGAVEHYYRAKRRFILDDSEWERLPKVVKEGFSANLCRLIIDEVKTAVEEGTFAARDAHFSRTRLEVDEQGWEDLNKTLNDTLLRVIAIQEECEKRLAKSGDEPILAAALVAAFEAPPRSKLGKKRSPLPTAG